MLEDKGWEELCGKLAVEEDPAKRIELLTEMQRAAGEEQDFLKLQIRPHVENYLKFKKSRIPRRDKQSVRE